jgi:PHP family Zn ribbon phosphoesterase
MRETPFRRPNPKKEWRNALSAQLGVGQIANDTKKKGAQALGGGDAFKIHVEREEGIAHNVFLRHMLTDQPSEETTDRRFQSLP